MYKIGEKVVVIKTNWAPKRDFIGGIYEVLDVIYEPDSRTYEYRLEGTGNTKWYNSELRSVRSRNDAISVMLDAANLAKYVENGKKTMEEWWYKMNPYFSTGLPKIKNVIFNDPATIVFWADGSKTVVKCQNDNIYDPEKGLAMAISKKALGNKGNYCNEIKKWLPKVDPVEDLRVLIATVESCRSCASSPAEIKAGTQRYAIKKAYDALVKYRDTDVNLDLDEVIGYLGEALEDGVWDT